MSYDDRDVIEAQEAFYDDLPSRSRRRKERLERLRQLDVRNMTITEIAEALCLCESATYRHLRDAGLQGQHKPKREFGEGRLYDWRQVDWSKTNREIADEHDIPREAVSDRRIELRTLHGWDV